MEGFELEGVAEDVDALWHALCEERARSVAGVDLEPALAHIFAAHPKAAHKATAAALREAGRPALADRVAALRAERAAAEREEAWRASEPLAMGIGPSGPASLFALELAIPREPDRARRLSLGQAAAKAVDAVSAEREGMLEVRARASAEVGLAPDWPAVVEGDEVLLTSDDAYRDVLAFRARRDLGLELAPSGDLTRADLLFLFAFAGWDGLFRRSALGEAVHATSGALGLDLDRIRVDEGDRPGQWPGVHVTGARLSFRQRGGAGDWQDLLEGLGRALCAAHGPPHRRDPALGAALGWLLGSLLLEPRWLSDHAGVDRRHAVDVRRDLALRRLFSLRAQGAAFRVASEVQRGLSGAAWREAYRESLTAAAAAAWDSARAARDGDAALHAAALCGAGAGEWLRVTVRERFDEDWWRNPRTAEYLAGLIAGGALPEIEVGASPQGTDFAQRPPSRAALALVGVLEGQRG